MFVFQVTLEDLCTGVTKKMKITRQVLNPDGRTTRPEEKLLTIEVKPGWKAGTKVTYEREGDQAPNTIPANVVFVIRDKPHPVFTRDGADIKYRAKVSLRDVCTVWWLLYTIQSAECMQLTQKIFVIDHIISHHYICMETDIPTSMKIGIDLFCLFLPFLFPLPVFFLRRSPNSTWLVTSRHDTFDVSR